MRSLAGRRELPCSLRARTVGSTASVGNSGVSSVAAVLAHRSHGPSQLSDSQLSDSQLSDSQLSDGTNSMRATRIIIATSPPTIASHDHSQPTVSVSSTNPASATIQTITV